MYNYDLAKKYYEHHGNSDIPRKFKTINGYDYDENGIALGNWIGTQRHAYCSNGTNKRLTEQQIVLLKKIGVIYDVNVDRWLYNYDLAKKYYEHHGNLDIHYNFKTINGYDYDENGIALGIWIGRQRQKYHSKGGGKNLTEQQIHLLEEISMVFDGINFNKWIHNYDLAKKYYEYHGNLDIPCNFKTTNGYDYDENGITLGSWIQRLRRIFKGTVNGNLTNEQKILLINIGMIWDDVNVDRWMHNYDLAKKYYEHYGNLDIPHNFKTINGYDYDENGITLGAWIGRQRRTYHGKGENKKLTEQQVNLLKEIGMIFDDVKLNRWIRNYDLAKKYYEHHGNLNIPIKFKTTNGYDYDENGITLGSWIQRLRQIFKGKINGNLTNKQKILLINIGMIWDAKKNQDEIKQKCLENNINCDKNKTILERISIQELQSKIEFLKSHNLSLVNKDGLLIDIFSMSSPDMKEKYGTSLEEIVSKFYVKKHSGKGV